MRKLIILKTIVDLFWIISIPILFILFLAIPAIFFIDDYDVFYFISGKFSQFMPPEKKVMFWVKCFFVPKLLAYILLYIALYYFKKMIEDFYRTKIFTNTNILYLNKIGNYLITSGLLITLTSLASSILISNEFYLDLGFSEPVICVCLGLFFKTLSEIFKISSQLKQENDLTI